MSSESNFTTRREFMLAAAAAAATPRSARAAARSLREFMQGSTQPMAPASFDLNRFA